MNRDDLFGALFVVVVAIAIAWGLWEFYQWAYTWSTHTLAFIVFVVVSVGAIGGFIKGATE